MNNDEDELRDERILNVNPETVRRLMALAREFHAQEDVVIPEEPANPSGDWGIQILAGHADDLTVQEFLSIVDDLGPDQQQEVVALMWLGRGDYAAEEWDSALTLAEEQWTEDTGAYLLAHPMLADELQAGLIALGYEEAAE
jgi:Protein of unknown function (DUF3775)